VAAQARSGETQRGFCARHGIAPSTFGWWQRRVRGEACDVIGPARDDTGAKGLFVELAQPSPVAAPISAAWDVELELGAGVVLRLRRAV
jgi:hypothetical protein